MNRNLNKNNSALGVKRACTNCGKCKAACPAGIDIPEVIRTYGRYEKNGRSAKETLPGSAGPEDCIECGACTSCCPEKIAVKDLMRELAMQQCQHRSHQAYVNALR